MDSFGSNLKRLRKKNKLTQDELASLLNIGKTTISNYETGYSSPDMDTIIEMARIFKVSTDYLLGRIVMEESGPNLMLSKEIVMVQIPVFGIIHSADPLKRGENIITYLDIPADQLGKGEFFGFRVFGDSINQSRLDAGDIVLVRKQDYVDNGDLALVLINGNAELRYYYQQGNNVVLVPNSDNKMYQPTVFDHSFQFSVIGKPVKAVINL